MRSGCRVGHPLVGGSDPPTRTSDPQLQVSCLVSADGPDSVRLRSDPSVFNGILSAELGSKVEMKCTSTAFPEPKYRWIHNGSLLSISEGNITLPSLTWEQMGRYRCIVENPVAQLTMYRDIQIQRKTGKCIRSPLGIRSPNLPTSMPLPTQCPSSGMPSPPCHLAHNGWMKSSRPLRSEPKAASSRKPPESSSQRWGEFQGDKVSPHLLSTQCPPPFQPV